MKKAMITGINGQDGSYLAEHLLRLGYEVCGILRRNSVPETQDMRISHLNDDIYTEYGDLLDVSSLHRLITKVQPDEIYNLAAQSHVRISFDVPQFTLQTNTLGVLNLLEAIRTHCPQTKFYQASSSEMFGNSVDPDKHQRETTPMHPVSPYGCAKLGAYHLVRTYRQSYNMFAANGILFNHESPRRGSNFVTSKIIKSAVEIKYRKRDKLYLGNLDSFRDWGHSKDYVRAMHIILQTDKPDDWVVSTGETHSVREFCDIVFKRLGLNYQDYVEVDPKFLRPQELNFLCGDSTKIRTTLNWKPTYSFEQLVHEMTDFWEARVEKSSILH
jgi:GDPmannose 4,6-dehydratase